MQKLIGLFVPVFMVIGFLTICTNESDARPFRRNRPVYSTTNQRNAQAGVVQRTTEKPSLPDVTEEIRKPSQQEAAKELTKTVEQKKETPKYSVLTEPVVTKGFSPYEILGLNFEEEIRLLPEQERELFETMITDSTPDYKSVMAEKYPDARPEVVETLAKIAEGVHHGKSRSELGKLVSEMPIRTSQLKSSEVLAINQELEPAVDGEEYQAIHGLNQFRMRSGLRPLVIDLLLVLVSRGHSGDMQRYGFFSHNSPVSGKGSFTSRAHQYGASASAENIYMGSYSGRAANSAWINSSGHRANMLGGFSRVGVGRIGGFFTQMFGR